jgi:hypothetical protein
LPGYKKALPSEGFFVSLEPRVHEPPPGLDPWKPLLLAGRVNLVLGLLASARIVLEIVETWVLPSEPRYLMNVGFEFLLAQGAVVSGIWLMKRRSWGATAATLIATAGLVTAAIDLAASGRRILTIAVLFTKTGRDMPLSVAYGSRLVMTVIHALYWPILLGLLHLELPGRDRNDVEATRARRAFWTCAGVSALLTGLIELLLKWIPGNY